MNFEKWVRIHYFPSQGLSVLPALSVMQVSSDVNQNAPRCLQASAFIIVQSSESDAYVFCFHSSHPRVMISLIPATTHNAYSTPPVPLEIQPPAMAPTSVRTKAVILRFLLTFANGGASSCVSLIKSHSRLVTTTVGTSLRPSVRLLTIWAADWKLSSAIGASSFHRTAEPLVAG